MASGTGAVGRPAERYGDPGPGRRRLVVALTAVLAAAGLAWVLWWALAQGSAVTATTQGHRVVDDAQVVVTFSVAKGADQTVRCQVQALSSGAAQVGLAVVDVGPSAGAASVQSVVVRTQQRATTGTVQGCTPL